MTEPMKCANCGELHHRRCGLDTSELETLDRACSPLAEAFGVCTYLVGTAAFCENFRDVDVRTMLDDEDFDRRFGGKDGDVFWSVFCYSVGKLLREQTGMNIDYQVQRCTQANENHNGTRDPIGVRPPRRLFAGGGDATDFYPKPPAGIKSQVIKLIEGVTAEEVEVTNQ